VYGCLTLDAFGPLLRDHQRHLAELELASQGDISEERARALLSDKRKLRQQFAKQVAPVLTGRSTRELNRFAISVEKKYCWVEARGVCLRGRYGNVPVMPAFGSDDELEATRSNTEDRGACIVCVLLVHATYFHGVALALSIVTGHANMFDGLTRAQLDAFGPLRVGIGKPRRHF